MKKIIRIILICLAIFIVLSIVLTAIYYKPVKNIYNFGISGKNNFLTAQTQLLQQDFEPARQSLSQAVNDFQEAEIEFSKLRWLKFLPWLGNQLSAVDNLLTAGINTGQAIQKINDLALQIITPLQEDYDISLASLSEEQTRGLLKDIYNTEPVLLEAKQSVDIAVMAIDKIPSRGLIQKLHEVVKPLKENVPAIQTAIDQAISISQIIPPIAGYPEQKTYLFLLQNNTEMRPTGGFIGTYGILKVKDGDIKHFDTDNTYNLDTPAENWLNVEPPWPLTRYNKVYKWLLRDANWSPDFPTSAAQAEWFYHQEKGPEQTIDGVIAITPTFIQSLLELVGEIQVDGLTFTAKNFVETLQYQVEQGYLRQGLELDDRKEIVGTLSTKLLDGILNLPQSQWTDLWRTFTKDVAEKNILLYMKEQNVQDFIIKEGWGGAIKETNHDYFAVIDANLASLKSDPGVKRSIDYSLQRDGDNLIADLSIAYKNEGTITWKTTRYRTYTRIYVPNDSKLITSSGSMIDCKIAGEGSIETTNELNKTVFGTFICIEPGEEQTLHLKYKLPTYIEEQLNNNTYQLLIQKQPGTANYSLTLQINLNKNIDQVETVGIDNYDISNNNKLSITTDLSLDKLIFINF